MSALVQIKPRVKPKRSTEYRTACVRCGASDQWELFKQSWYSTRTGTRTEYVAACNGCYGLGDQYAYGTSFEDAITEWNEDHESSN